MKLAYVAAAAVAGIYLGQLLALPWFLWVAAVGSALVAARLFYRSGGRPRLASLVLVALLLGALRSPPPAGVSPESLAYYNGQRVTITARVATDPEARDRTQRLRLEALSIEVAEQPQPVVGSLVAWTSPYPSYAYGDVLSLEGTLEAPPRLPGFDYRDYLARQGIYSVMSYPRVSLREQGNPDLSGWAWVYGLRHRLAGSLARSLPEPQASLAQALLLGLRRSLPAELSDAFNRTGTTHLLAISGLHVSIVAGFLLYLGMGLLGRRRGFYLLLPLFGVWGYALLSGLGPPVVRAAIMASIYLWGHYLGRPRSTITALAVAAALMVGLEPALLGQVSFQLSFLAIAGLVLLAPPLEAGLHRAAHRLLGEGMARWARPVAVGVAISLAAMALTYPLIAFYFHRVSLVGLPATLLVLPALPVVLATSAMAAVAGLVAPALGQLMGGLAWPWLSYLAGVVRAWDALPGAALDIGAFSPALVAVYYALLGLALAAWRFRPATIGVPVVPGSRWGRLVLLLVLLTLVGLVWGTALSRPDSRLHVYFLDVGQGDAILIQTSGGHQVLIDGGPSPQALTRALGRRLPFWDRSLDVVVLSHPQEDHLAGLVEVLSRYQVGVVVEGPPPGLASSLYQEWERRVEASAGQRLEARPGLTLRLGRGATLEVLHPPERLLKETGADTNNNSVVLRLQAGGVSFLFPGDVEGVGEGYLLAGDTDLRATVLKVAHHGSATSSSPEFVTAVHPQVAVISVGVDNTLGHPSPEVMARLRQAVGDNLYLTSEQGTIELITDGQRLWVRTERLPVR